MTEKAAKAGVNPMRQRTQYTCMSTSMAMCLQALGLDCSEDEVNKVMGARPMKGASWEQALACSQHFGCRSTLTMPSTVHQLKAWTDRGVPVMIAWNPEGRDWSHASVVFDVTPCEEHGFMVHVADPNIPDPEETVRKVPKKEFYQKWYEKWPNYLVRRPACAIEREVTPDGRQVMASAKEARRDSDLTSRHEEGWAKFGRAFAQAFTKTAGAGPLDVQVVEGHWTSGALINYGPLIGERYKSFSVQFSGSTAPNESYPPTFSVTIFEGRGGVFEVEDPITFAIQKSAQRQLSKYGKVKRHTDGSASVFTVTLPDEAAAEAFWGTGHTAGAAIGQAAAGAVKGMRMATFKGSTSVVADMFEARAKRKKKPKSQKDKMKIPTETPKDKSNPYAEAAGQRKTTPGHKRKERGRNVEKGHSRKPKHKKDPRRQMAASVSDRWLEACGCVPDGPLFNFLTDEDPNG